MFGLSKEKPVRWLHLPIEKRVREFDARLLLGCCAVDRGYKVILGKKNSMSRSYPELPRGIIFERSLLAAREEEFARLVSQGFHLSGMDEESIFFYKHPDTALQIRISANNLEIFDWYLCWGKGQEDLIRKAFPKHMDKVITTGTYRNDLYRKEFNVYWDDTIAQLREQYGRIILFPSNFTMAINARGGRDFVMNVLSKHGAVSSKEDRAFFEDKLDHEMRAFVAYKSVFKKVREAFPDHQIILRHHPGEDPAIWEEIARNDTGITAIHEGPILPWLAASDAVFHHGCSTGFEAFIMDKPSIPYHPVYDEKFDSHLSTQIGPIAHTPEKLIEFLQLAIDGEPLPRGDLSWLDNYMNIPDGLSSDLIIDAFDKVTMKLGRERSLSRQPAAIKLAVQGWCTRMTRKVKRNIGKPVSPTISTQQWGYLSRQDVQDKVHALDRATGRFAGIKVKKLRGQMFMLYKGDASTS